MSSVYVINHPLLKHSLTILRDKNTKTEEFRRHSAIVSQIMIMEATRDLTLTEKSVETPLETMKGSKIQDGLVFVPVLRAGISMLFPARDFLPWVSVGFIGLERDEQTAIARQYYQKFPAQLENKKVLVLDPMLATGGSASAAIAMLKRERAGNIKLVCIVGAPEGVRRIEHDHPDVEIFLAALDEGLNDKGYIVPGLGDAGDRLYGTK